MHPILFKKINMNIQVIRRSLTKKLSNIFKTTNQEFYKNVDRNEIKSILVIRPNHRLGNQILVTPLLCELESQFPNAKITYFGKGNLSVSLFKNFKNVEHYIILPKNHFKEIHKYLYCWISLFLFKKFDLVINVNNHSSSGNLLTTISKARFKVLNNDFTKETLQCTERHFAKVPIENLRKSFHYHLNEQYPPLNLKYEESSKDELSWYQNHVSRTTKPVIFLFTNATGGKDYDETFWNELYQNLKIELSNHHIVEMLPVENVSKFDFKIDSFYSTSMDEMCTVLNQGALCITGDCGIMHLSVASRIPTIALFKNKNTENYEPYGGYSRSLITDQLTMNEIVSEIVKTTDNL